MRGLFAAVLLSWHAAAFAALDLALSLDRIDHPAFVAERVRLRPAAGGATLDIGVLRAAGREFRGLRLHCRELSLAADDIACRGGKAKVGADGTVALDFHYTAKTRALELTLRDAPLADIAALWPPLAAWRPRGRAELALRLAAGRAEFALTTKEAAFADEAGTRAGEGIALRVAGEAREEAGAWHWRAEAAWQGGEVYWQPWYLKGEAQTLAANGSLDAESLRIDAARLSLPGIGKLDARASWDRRRGALAALSLASDAWLAAPAWAAFGQPLVGESPRIAPAGSLRFALERDAGGLAGLDLDLALDEIDIAAGRYRLDGLRVELPWRRAVATRARIAANGGLIGAVPLGAFAVPFDLDGWSVACARAELPLLDGSLLLEDFAARRENGRWEWRLAGALKPLSMPLLTQKLGLPRMEGLLSATIPRVGYEEGVLALDGTLIVSLFGGYLAAERLRVIEPFGRAPRLSADVDARHLDLAMLTETFSFGSITGQIDAELRGLDMLGWQPQAFAARVETSPGEFRKRISQRAVQNISSLGGAGAGAAIQRSFLRFFETFGYDRIGLSCRLAGGVCEMGGIAESGGGYLMVKGGGLPSLNVIGYNRRVGWDELVGRLKAIAAGNSRPVIE